MFEQRSILSTKLRGAAVELRHLPRVLRLIWAASRRWSLLWAALLIMQGLLPVALVYVTRDLVDGLAGVIGTSADWHRALPVLIDAALVGAVLLLAELLRGAAAWVRTVQASLISDHVSGLVHEKSANVDLEFYDSPEYHDHLHRARAEASSRPIALLENGGSLVQHGITLIGMAAILIPYGVWMPVALVLSTLPALLVVMRFALRQHRWRAQVTQDERRTIYYDGLLTEGESAAELRLFGLGDHFRFAFQELRQQLRHGHLRLIKAQTIADLGASFLALAVSAVCLAWMMLQAIEGSATLGDLVLFYQAFSMGQSVVRTLLGNAGQIYYNLLFLGNLFAFLDLRSAVVEPLSPIPPPAIATGQAGLDVRLENVSFCYPGRSRAALSDLSVEFSAGRVVAIVGRNGAGKSTLLSLLCRFYDPQKGRILFNGVDLRDLSLRGLRHMVTVLFQEPVRYSASVAENIAYGHRMARPDRSAIEAAARAAGADTLIERLPQGYDTLLGNWFAEGVELSVGEWQRIALARAFLRPSPVIILDEPTSAMDSWAEADWLQRFRGLANGRTAIIITHRFTTAMQADVIHVMDEGRIVESGSHAQLIARSGGYAESWQRQTDAGRNV